MTSFAADRGRRTAETDRWLAGMLGAEPGVALVAVGGYGRKELLPGSDLDVLLLHEGREGIAKIADRIWYPVWDSGARLDHAVRTVPQARRVARNDLKVALGLLNSRHVAGDPDLTTRLREGALEDWRANARTRLAELKELHEERTRLHGELAFLLEPDLKESRGGQRDVHAIQAIAAAWVAPAPGPKVRAAYEQILDARHVLHEVTGRRLDRLVLEEQDEVARTLGLLDGDQLLRNLAGDGRTVAYAVDHAFRQAERAGGRRALGVRIRRGKLERRPLADGVVEQDGEVVLARAASPGTDPVLVLRAAAAAAQAGLPIAPRALARLGECPPLPVPWPADARDALLTLLGAGPSAIPVWEALDQEGLLTPLIPDWERVRNRPQRNPLHRFTVDRHLVECAANAAALTRDVARPDLLLLACLLHDIGKGWPGDHSVSGEVVARDVARRVGLSEQDAEVIAAAARYHLLLPVVATRRDLDDPMTVRHVAETLGSRLLLELLQALAQADGLATGPAAWNDWKAGLVADLVRRVSVVLDGDPLPEPVPLREDQLALVTQGGPAAIVNGSEVTVVALDRPGLLWRAAGVLASHRLAVRGANAAAVGDTAVTVFSVAPEYGDPPDAALVAADLRRMLEGRLDVEDRLERRARNARPIGATAPPPKVTLVDGASQTATVVEVRAHDEPGLLWRIGRALGDCGLDVRAARVETLGAEAVDVFYVTDSAGGPLTDPDVRKRTVSTVLAALTPALSPGRAAGPFPSRLDGSLGNVFETLSDRLTQVFSSLRGKGRLSAADIDATAREIRIALLEADVALPVVRQFIAAIKERASGEEVSAALNPAQQVIKIVHEELVTILGGETRRLRFAKAAPTVIMLAGLQGSGKTTLAGKLALWLKEQGNTPLLVACDLQRPNAVQQLQVLGQRAGVPVYAPAPGNGVGDPVAVARSCLDEARRAQHNMVIIDTAGRLGIDAEMMAQARAIRDAVEPDEVLFVVDAMIGQDAVATAQAFLDGVGYDGVVLTKLDGDARGGAALSITALTGKPIMFASTGEKLSDFDMFHPDRMATRILDMGDILTLIEKAEKAFDQSQAEAMASRMMTGEGFTLEDFVEQLGMLRKLGPIQNLLGMMPGATKNKELLSRVNDKDLDRAEAIVRSMTPEERRNPKVINGSRRLRIAKGSGVTVGQVSELVTNFFEGQRQMKMLLGGAMPGMPPMPGMGRRGGASARQAKAAKNKRKHPGGDPRKAALAGSGAAPGGPAGRGGATAAAEPAAPKSMAELSEMLREATEGGGLGLPGQGGPVGDGFAGFRGGPGSLPQLPGNGTGAGNTPAAFGGKGNAKKKRKK